MQGCMYRRGGGSGTSKGARTVAAGPEIGPALQSNTAIDSTCAVCGNMLTTPAAARR